MLVLGAAILAINFLGSLGGTCPPTSDPLRQLTIFYHKRSIDVRGFQVLSVNMSVDYGRDVDNLSVDQ